MKKITGTVLTVVISALLFTGCAKEEEGITEKTPSKIDEITTEAADAMVKKIRTPINKARLTQDLGDKRL